MTTAMTVILTLLFVLHHLLREMSFSFKMLHHVHQLSN